MCPAAPLDYIHIALASDKNRPTDAFVVLENPIYPLAPVWPKKGLFMLWGVVGGLFASLFLAAIRSSFDGAALHADGLAGRLGIPLLGELPAVPWRKPLPKTAIDGAG